MPIPDYPTSLLPYDPWSNGFIRRLHHKPVSSFEPEDGPAILRISSNTRIKQFAYRLVFSNQEYSVWESFCEVTLGQATRHFMMPVPLIGQDFVNRRVYLEGASWTDEPFGEGTGHWAVQFVLNVFNSPSA